nr:hypothetical transcript [Hymenolepis microstoma]
MVNGKGTRVNPFTAKNITLLRPNCHVADKKGLDDFGKRMRNRAKYGNFLDSVGDDYYGRARRHLMLMYKSESVMTKNLRSQYAAPASKSKTDPAVIFLGVCYLLSEESGNSGYSVL